MKVRREQVAELQKQTLELVERGKTLIRKLEDRRRVMEKLIAVEKMDTVISVAREALDQYKNALVAFEGVAERSNSYVVPGS
jgi:ribosomal protein L17